MKKYFCTETDEICNFGDVIHLVFYKDIKDGKVTVEKDVVFSEDTMDWMIEMGFVEEREVNDDLIDFADEEPCETLAELIEDFEAFEERVDKMEEMIKEVYDLIKLSAKEEKKNVKSQKK